MTLIAIIDHAVAEALSAQGDLLTTKGKEGGRAHKLIVRKVSKALRESLSVSKDDDAEVPVETPKAPEAQSEYWQCEIWSKEWWALFFATIARGKSVGFMLDQAIKAQRGTPWATKFDQRPPVGLIDRMQSYPSDGKAVEAWRNYLARKAIRLPEWRSKVWVFLPDSEPPSAA